MLAVSDISFATRALNLAKPDHIRPAAFGWIPPTPVFEAEHTAHKLGSVLSETARADRAPCVLEEDFEPAT